MNGHIGNPVSGIPVVWIGDLDPCFLDGKSETRAPHLQTSQLTNSQLLARSYRNFAKGMRTCDMAALCKTTADVLCGEAEKLLNSAANAIRVSSHFASALLDGLKL